MTEVIDVPKLVEILDEIVSKVPEDYTAVCYYSNQGMAYLDWEESRYEVNDDGEEYKVPGEFKFTDAVTPVCIAGHVVYKLGGEESLLKLIEDTTIAPNPRDRFSIGREKSNEDVLRELGLTDDAIEALRKAQYVQDSAMPWVEAVNEIRV